MTPLYKYIIEWLEWAKVKPECMEKLAKYYYEMNPKDYADIYNKQR